MTVQELGDWLQDKLEYEEIELNTKVYISHYDQFSNQYLDEVQTITTSDDKTIMVMS